MKNKGLLIVLAGFSGTGKGTIVKEVIRRRPDAYALSVSATTRAPRAGEEDGREYFFCTPERFSQMVRDGALLEHAEFVGHSYGTPRSYVEEQLQLGRNVILEIECRGAMQVKKAMPDAVLVFVLPPSIATLSARLRGRNTESDADIRARLEKAAEEYTYIPSFDYIIINDELDAAVDAFEEVIRTAGRTPAENERFIRNIGEELDVVLERLKTEN